MSSSTPDPHASEAMSVAQWAMLLEQQQHVVAQQQQQITQLHRQLEWFKRQLFGSKSERFVGEPDPAQLSLMAALAEVAPTPEEGKAQTISYSRQPRRRDDMANHDGDTLFFDRSKVPVQTIVLPAPTAGLSPDHYEVIGEKVSYRLAQRPGSYVVLEYKRPLIKVAGEVPRCAPAPQGVLEGSRADVSLQVGLVVDKFVWHMPLHRQHQRMGQSGLRVSRPWLTQLAQATIELLRPIYTAQLLSIRESHVIAMDETPIKAGVDKGKMKKGYFWPVHGEQGEMCFHYAASRSHANVRQILGETLSPGTVLLSDGYAAYARYTEQLKVTHAQCWAHTRRHFFEAQDIEREAAQEALRRIGVLYQHEQTLRDKKLQGEDKRRYRAEHSRPEVAAFFDWVQEQLHRSDLLPSNPFSKALGYARERRASLEVFLADPAVEIDTNHVERGLRVIPMGRKNYLFCWTELGAEHVGIIQSLLVTCRLQGIDPYTYLVDVLQRMDRHPASRIAELTPRLWKQHFAHAPLRSDLELHLKTAD